MREFSHKTVIPAMYLVIGIIFLLASASKYCFAKAQQPPLPQTQKEARYVLQNMLKTNPAEEGQLKILPQAPDNMTAKQAHFGPVVNMAINAIGEMLKPNNETAQVAKINSRPGANAAGELNASNLLSQSTVLQEVLELISDQNTHGIHLKVTTGLCVPDSCRSSDVKGLFSLDSDFPSAYMPHRENYRGAITIVANSDNRVISNGSADIQGNGENQGEVTSSLLQEDKNYRDPLIERMLICFSVYTNAPKLLNAHTGRDAITCVHGIRFLSLTWVIIGHTYSYGILSQDETFTTDNLLDFAPIYERFTFQAVIGGGFAVDTFFVLSAFLVTWLQLKDIAKRTKKCSIGHFIMYYFHRFWRLTPLYMLVLMAFACLYQYLGSGPFWPSKIWDAEHCKTNWWTNLLYVNNVVGTNAQERATGLAIIYSPYSDNRDGDGKWSPVQRGLYESLGRPAWGVCVAWVIFACHTGCGGIVNSLLSWSGIVPLSRLTYAAYLVHPICMKVYFYSRRVIFHVNDYSMQLH
ncbi:NRF6-like protein [Mya arenaria]|uniref:NRF6-like protein n=1 Tax=Mya arenaria TaxID=6604 RepID=A0ABY7F1D7_MYAAR|nr:NRF6-like protein [Mya arenaria]